MHTVQGVHTPWEDTAWHYSKWFPELCGKLNNAVCGLIRMESKDQRARLQLLGELSLSPQLTVELSLQSVGM